jgi:hypothetical protein
LERYLYGCFYRILIMKQILSFFLLFGFVGLHAQTKVGGIVLDEAGEPVAFANVLFKNSTEGTISNDNGRFYMESDNVYDILLVSFIGFENQEIILERKVTYDMNIVLLEATEQLSGVVLISGKQSKKNNPAVEILKKIWAKNGRTVFANLINTLLINMRRLNLI